MIVGTFQPKKTKEGKDFYDLVMKVPFQKETNMYVVKNDKQTGEHSPQMRIFYSGNQAGAIWKKTSQKGEDYLSGSVFCLGMPENRLSFAIFKSKDSAQKDENGNLLNYVVISEGERKGNNSEDHLPEGEVF
jgi:uncharacterized protein (DUF736 family)